MSFGLGLFVVFASMITGYLGGGGNIMVIFQPFELLLIIGTAMGSFIISTPKHLRAEVISCLKKIGAKHQYHKEHYTILLLFLFNFLKKVRTATAIEIESYLDNPENNSLFDGLRTLPNSEAITTFFCDSFRMVMLGVDNPHEIDNMIECVIQRTFDKMKEAGAAIHTLGEALPGLGIVAAVTGVIIAMGAVGADAATLSIKIASAMVGTLVGVFLSYGVVSPIGTLFEKIASDNIVPLECIKMAIITYVAGHPPSLCMELARQILPAESKPPIIELENAVNLLSNQ